MSQQITRRQQVLALLGLALVLFLVSLDQTVVGTAMPRIIAELSGFELYAWVTTAYLLAETVGLPVVGKLGDMYGRKWITVVGVAIFVVASAACGTANSMLWLVGYRGLQGLGGGILLSTVFALIADIFPDLKDRARYQGLMFSVFAFSSVVGPVLGGWITDTWTWRWVFYVNLPLGLLALGMLPKVLPQNARQPGGRIDYLGAMTSTLAVVALLLALELVSTGHEWSSPEVISGLALAGLAFTAFIPIESKAVEPIIPLALFRNRTFTLMVMLSFLFGWAMFGIILYAPLLVQGVLGQSASGSGAVMAPMMITQTIVGIIVGQLIARFGKAKLFLLLGTSVMTFGVFLLTTLHSGSSPLLASLFLLVIAMGMGMVMPVSMLIIQMIVEQRVLGVATAVTQFIRSIGSTMGAALVGTIVTRSYVKTLSANAPPGVPEQAITALHSPNALINQEALQHLMQIMANTPNQAALTQALLDVARSGLASAIQSGFFLVLGVSILAVASALFTKNIRTDSNDPTHRGAAPFH